MYEFWREIFAPDGGALLDIWVYDTSTKDYRVLLPFVVSHFSGRYMRDGVESDVPDYDTILTDYDNASVFVKINVTGVQVNMWFHSEEEMNLDILPDEVDTLEKASSIFELMKAIARQLNKRVLMTAENASADRDWSERHCICSIRPNDASVIYHADSDGWTRY